MPSSIRSSSTAATAITAFMICLGTGSVAEAFSLDFTVTHSFGPVGGGFTGRPSVVSWSPGRRDLFITTENGDLGTALFTEGYGWHDLESLGQPSEGGLVSSPACVARGYERIDCFVRGPGYKLWTKRYEGPADGWSAWEDLGKPQNVDLVFAPTVASWASNRLDVFSVGDDGNLHTIFWNGSSWSSWQFGNHGKPPTTQFAAEPSCISKAWGRINCFAVGTDGYLWEKYYGSSWSPWLQTLGHPTGVLLKSPPATASFDSDHIQVVVSGNDFGGYYGREFDGGWAEWMSLPGLPIFNPDGAGCIYTWNNPFGLTCYFAAEYGLWEMSRTFWFE